MKTCKGCLTEKGQEEFYTCPSRNDGLSYYCKICSKAGSVARNKAKPEQRLLVTVRHRAKTRGLDFDLTLEDIVVPEFCPILGIPLIRGQGVGKHLPNSPSIDRIDNSRGYVRGNVWIISKRANTMKSDASLEELQLFAKWVNSLD